MDVPCPDAYLLEIAVQLLRHALGERGHEDSLVHFRPLPYFFEQVVHLVLCRPDLYRRIQQAGRPYDLFHHQSLALLELIF